MTFTYHGTPLVELDHPYNTTAQNERAVEVPIAEAFLAGVGDGPGLEVGNVLGHYGVDIDRIIVDRYERAAGVLNLDIRTCRFPVDWIVSISTVEHVGFDDEPSVAEGAIEAIAHLRYMLAPGGRMLLTAPLGYNPALDEAVLGGRSGATIEATLVRHGDAWEQTPELTTGPYLGSGRGATSVWVAEYGGAQ